MQALFKTTVKKLIYLSLFITYSLSYGQQWSTPVKTMAVKFQQWPTSQQGLEIVFKYVNNADH